MRYVLTKGPDGTVWCPVQPLMLDIKDSMDKLEQINTSELSSLDKDIMDFNILGMKAIYTFLGALLQEQKDNESTKESTGPSIH